MTTRRLPKAALRRRSTNPTRPSLFVFLTFRRPMIRPLFTVRTVIFTPRTAIARRSLTVMIIRIRLVAFTPFLKYRTEAMRTPTALAADTYAGATVAYRVSSETPCLSVIRTLISLLVPGGTGTANVPFGCRDERASMPFETRVTTPCGCRRTSVRRRLPVNLRTAASVPAPTWSCAFASGFAREEARCVYGGPSPQDRCGSSSPATEREPPTGSP
jgi:hypothetical protein